MTMPPSHRDQAATPSWRWRRAASLGAVALALAPAGAATVDGADPLLPPAWTRSGWQPAAERFDVDHETASVPMDDGITLKVDILYPRDRASGRRASGPFPVLLEQTPYRWRGFADTAAVVARGRYFVSRGYIYVLASQRGTADNGGSYDLLGPREAEDGKLLVEWASRLQGGTGKIGLVGCSADGLNQFLTAARLGPGSPVKAMAAGGIGDNLYSEPVFPGGILSSEGDWFFEGVVPQLGTESAIRKSLDVLANIRSGGDKARLDAFWNGISAGAAVEQVVRNDIPVLLYSSWQDVYPSSPYLLTMLQNAKAGRPLYGPFPAGQTASPRYQIIMAPGPHCAGDKGGPRDQASFRWFETWLRDAPTGLKTIATPFHFHTLNAPGWRSFANAPQTGAYKTLFLGSGGTLAAIPAGGEAVRVAFGNRDGAGVANATFTTEPFAAPAYLAGAATVTVTITTASPDALLIGDLYDVAPDGGETRLTRGDLIASMRTPSPARDWRLADGTLVRAGHDFSRPAPVEPGRPMEIAFSLQPRLARIDKGHRLRLVLKGRSDFGTGDCHRELGPYPCLVGTLPQQKALTDSSYSLAPDGRLVLPLLAEADGKAPRP